MIDVRDLLERAAPAPEAPFDAAQFVAQARAPKRPWRRWLAWGAGVIALVGGALGAGTLAPAGGGDTALRQPSHGPTTTLAADEGAVMVRSATGREQAVPSEAPTTAIVAGPGQGKAPARSESVEPTSADGEARKEGCFVQTGERCEYNASVPGGYQGFGPWEMWIVRGGTTTYYNGLATGQDPGAACADIGFVQAGDHVIVSAPEAWEEGDTGFRWPTSGNDPGMPPNPRSWIAVGTHASCEGYSG